MAHAEETFHVEFSPDGTLLASGSADCTVKLWDLASMRMILRLPVFSEAGVIPAFHPGGQMLAVGSTEGVRLYELMGLDISITRAFAPNTVRGFAFCSSRRAADPPVLVTVRNESEKPPQQLRTLELWPSSALEPLRAGALDSPARRLADSMEIEPDKTGQHLLVRQRADMVLFDLDRIQDQGRRAAINRPDVVRFAPEGQVVWSVADGSIESRQLPDLTVRTRWEYHPPTESKGRVGISDLDAGRNWVVAGTRAGRLLVVRAGDGQLDYMTRTDDPIQVVALSPDESLVACGTQRGGLDLIRLRDGQSMVQVAAHAEMVTGMAFHPSGDYLVTIARDRFLILWKIGSASVTELLRIIPASRGAATMVRFSPDGRYLGVLVAGEQAIRLWDLKRLRRELGTLELDWQEGTAGHAALR
jgi:WD40 repeat protein